MENTPAKPPYWKPLRHHNKRRAPWHDYKSRCIYMVTINKRQGAPVFGYLRGESAAGAYVELTAAGATVAAEIKATPSHNPQVSILGLAVMPDHLHFLIFVKQPTSRPLGSIVRDIKAAVSSKLGISGGIFEEGFHDRILYGEGQLGTMRRYIADNSRRLHIKRHNPDLFKRYNHLSIDGTEFAAYGNMFLLRNFDKMNVVVHRADTPDERERSRRRWLRCAANGGVLVSPFISQAEKEIRDKAIEAGGNLIILRNEGFEERFKPQGIEFELCAEGRLLLLAPWPEALNRAVVTRRQALAMNSLAEKLAAIGPDTPISLRK